jgi:hypothetical protein
VKTVHAIGLYAGAGLLWIFIGVMRLPLVIKRIFKDAHY